MIKEKSKHTATKESAPDLIRFEDVSIVSSLVSFLWFPPAEVLRVVVLLHRCRYWSYQRLGPSDGAGDKLTKYLGRSSRLPGASLSFSQCMKLLLWKCGSYNNVFIVGHNSMATIYNHPVRKCLTVSALLWGKKKNLVAHLGLSFKGKEDDIGMATRSGVGERWHPGGIKGRHPPGESSAAHLPSWDCLRVWLHSYCCCAGVLYCPLWRTCWLCDTLFLTVEKDP